mgnify:CR=1 FL=1
MVIEKAKTNPNKANQHIPDPRQALFLANYLNPKSETFSKAFHSAIKAGYEESYANALMGLMPEWLYGAIKKNEMLDKAERNLDKMLDLETKEAIITMLGPLIDEKTGQIVKKENSNLLRIKADISKFIAERIGKHIYGQDEKDRGDTYNFLTIFADDRTKRIARRVLAGGESSKE